MKFKNVQQLNCINYSLNDHLRAVMVALSKSASPLLKTCTFS